MERIRGLTEYIKDPKYRSALELPEEQEETYTLLAQGEYNINYRFTHPVMKKELLLRINCGSQMHLENQIEYEAHALKLLEDSGRTPRVLYVDDSRNRLSQGVLVMEYLPGHPLQYETELMDAAAILADIHSTPVPEKHGLLSPEDPLKAILEECESMVKTYMNSPLGEDTVKVRLRRMLDLGWKSLEKTGRVKENYRCIINTELNSANFLINEDKRNYLIDWEKPLYGEPAQDLGHFLAPTTTFWKTDVILTPVEIEAFLDRYMEEVGGRFPKKEIRERTRLFIPITCLRGLTWCAMAWVQYKDPEKLIINASTAAKLDAYLSDAFLRSIEILWEQTQ